MTDLNKRVLFNGLFGLLIWWANGGITAGLWYQLQSFVFILFLIIMTWWSTVRKYLLGSFVALFILMIVFYVSDLSFMANLAGSTWFGILIIYITLNLPKLIKEGCF